MNTRKAARLRSWMLRGALAGAVSAMLVAFSPVLSAQSWRTTALASFDLIWQTVNDTYYDATFGGLDWAAVSRELRPRVERAATPDEARDAMRALLARLGRSHFMLLTPSAAEALPGPASVPVDVRISGNDAIITHVWSPEAAAAGVSPGMVVEAVDGQIVADLFQGQTASDERTRHYLRWQQLNRVLHGDESTSARLRVKPVDGPAREVVVARRLPEGDVVQVGNLPPLPVQFEARDVRTPKGQDVGVIDFNMWMVPVASPITLAVDRFRQRAGIIIDLRGNTGGLMSMIQGVAGHFVGDPLLLGRMKTRQSQFVFHANPRTVLDDGRKVEVYGGPVAILVDELTASTSELFASSMQAIGRARVFGRPTMGQALPAMTKRLPSGDILMYGIGDFTTANGETVEGEGVRPDERVPLSRASLARGADDILDAALRWIDTAVRAGR